MFAAARGFASILPLSFVLETGSFCDSGWFDRKGDRLLKGYSTSWSTETLPRRSILEQFTAQTKPQLHRVFLNPTKALYVG